MSDEGAGIFTDEQLRSALRESARIAGDGRDCPSPDRLRQSARGELRAAEQREIVEHLGVCTACGAAWRLARRLATDRAASHERPDAQPSVWRRWAPLAAAAAAVIVAVLATFELFGPVDRPQVHRAEHETWLQSAIPVDEPCPRSDCMLRWTPGPEGTTYRLRVTDEDLSVLAVGRRLERAEFLVPADALGDLPSGSRLYWQVTASLPDGRQVNSETFIVAIE